MTSLSRESLEGKKRKQRIKAGITILLLIPVLTVLWLIPNDTFHNVLLTILLAFSAVGITKFVDTIFGVDDF